MNANRLLEPSNGKPVGPAPSANGSNGEHRARVSDAERNGTGAAPSANGVNGGSGPSAHKGERQANGRFAPGNLGGPGNPYARLVAALKRALIEATTPEDIAAIASKLIALAKDGNVPAAKLLFRYTLGEPAPATNPDQVDTDEWQRHRETANLTFETKDLLNKPNPEPLLRAIRVGRHQTIQNVFDAFLANLAPTTTRQEAANLSELSILSPRKYRRKIRALAKKARRELDKKRAKQSAIA